MRITPAYAGNTISKEPTALYTKDHPRLRGEHGNSPCGVVLGIGSPPPTRGTLLI